MAEEIFLQQWIFTRFLLPFLLVFVLIYAVLEKTKVVGEKHQVNAIIAFAIAALFVGVAYPTTVVSNLTLFLSVALVVVFVTLLIWGFLSGGNEFKLPDSKALKIVLFILVIIAVAIAVFWATGIQGGISDFLFKQNWSKDFWTNLLFIILVGVALALIVGGKKGNK
jgi:hypothetical protein